MSSCNNTLLSSQWTNSSSKTTSGCLCFYFHLFEHFWHFVFRLSCYQTSNSVTALCRSSLRGCSVRKGVLRNFAKFKGKHLCQSLFFNKFARLRPATLWKKRLWLMCFPVNFAKFLRTPYLQNTSRRHCWFRHYVHSFGSKQEKTWLQYLNSFPLSLSFKYFL